MAYYETSIVTWSDKKLEMYGERKVRRTNGLIEHEQLSDLDAPSEGFEV